MQLRETTAERETAATRAGAPLNAELEDYRRQFEAIAEDARLLVEGLSDAQFNWRATPGSWSIAECLSHLNLTGQVYLQVVDRAIKRAREEGRLGDGPFRHGLLGNMFIRATEPPVKRMKVKAPKVIAPLPAHLLAVVAPAFTTLQQQLLRRLDDANGLDLGRVKIRSPFLKLLRLSLGQSIAAIAAHERRHLWQARQVREHADFGK